MCSRSEGSAHSRTSTPATRKPVRLRRTDDPSPSSSSRLLQDGHGRASEKCEEQQLGDVAAGAVPFARTRWFWGTIGLAVPYGFVTALTLVEALLVDPSRGWALVGGSLVLIAGLYGAGVLAFRVPVLRRARIQQAGQGARSCWSSWTEHLRRALSGRGPPGSGEGRRRLLRLLREQFAPWFHEYRSGRRNRAHPDRGGRARGHLASAHVHRPLGRAGAGAPSAVRADLICCPRRADTVCVDGASAATASARQPDRAPLTRAGNGRWHPIAGPPARHGRSFNASGW